VPGTGNTGRGKKKWRAINREDPRLAENMRAHLLGWHSLVNPPPSPQASPLVCLSVGVTGRLTYTDRQEPEISLSFDRSFKIELLIISHFEGVNSHFKSPTIVFTIFLNVEVVVLTSLYHHSKTIYLREFLPILGEKVLRKYGCRLFFR